MCSHFVQLLSCVATSTYHKLTYDPIFSTYPLMLPMRRRCEGLVHWRANQLLRDLSLKRSAPACGVSIYTGTLAGDSEEARRRCGWSKRRRNSYYKHKQHSSPAALAKLCDDNCASLQACSSTRYPAVASCTSAAACTCKGCAGMYYQDGF